MFIIAISELVTAACNNISLRDLVAENGAGNVEICTVYRSFMLSMLQSWQMICTCNIP